LEKARGTAEVTIEGNQSAQIEVQTILGYNSSVARRQRTLTVATHIVVSLRIKQRLLLRGLHHMANKTSN
jgi:hypothetical protein